MCYRQRQIRRRIHQTIWYTIFKVRMRISNRNVRQSQISTIFILLFVYVRRFGHHSLLSQSETSAQRYHLRTIFYAWYWVASVQYVLELFVTVCGLLCCRPLGSRIIDMKLTLCLLWHGNEWRKYLSFLLLNFLLYDDDTGSEKGLWRMLYYHWYWAFIYRWRMRVQKVHLKSFSLVVMIIYHDY